MCRDVYILQPGVIRLFAKFVGLPGVINGGNSGRFLWLSVSGFKTDLLSEKNERMKFLFKLATA